MALLTMALLTMALLTTAARLLLGPRRLRIRLEPVVLGHLRLEILEGVDKHVGARQCHLAWHDHIYITGTW